MDEGRVSGLIGQTDITFRVERDSGTKGETASFSPPMNLTDCWTQLLSNKLGLAAWVGWQVGANYQTHGVQFR